MSDEQLRRAIEDRDELQRRIDAYEGRLEEWEEIDRLIAASSLGGVEAQRVRDTVPPQVGKAIVRAMQEAERADRAEEERDRLREEVKAERDISLASGCPDCGVHDGCYRVVAERDRLREAQSREQDAADAARTAREKAWRRIRELEAERDRLRAVVEIANRVVDRRDPEQWSVDHNAFAELGAALEQLDAGPAGEDT